MKLSKLDRKHVSDADKMLHAFDEANPEKTAAQQAEIEKFIKIDQTRDHGLSNPAPEENGIWEDF